MSTPDPRPEAETAAVLLGQIRAQVCCCEDAAECGPLEQISAARAEMDRLLDGYREQVVAEARAALLADAPFMWVARDDDGIGWMFGVQPKKNRNGGWDTRPPNYREAVDSLPDALHVEPGTCVRYRLVPDPEETP